MGVLPALLLASSSLIPSSGRPPYQRKLFWVAPPKSARIERRELPAKALVNILPNGNYIGIILAMICAYQSQFELVFAKEIMK
jgi:hypothetical protein